MTGKAYKLSHRCPVPDELDKLGKRGTRVKLRVIRGRLASKEGTEQI